MELEEECGFVAALNCARMMRSLLAHTLRLLPIVGEHADVQRSAKRVGIEEHVINNLEKDERAADSEAAVGCAKSVVLFRM